MIRTVGRLLVRPLAKTDRTEHDSCAEGDELEEKT